MPVIAVMVLAIVAGIFVWNTYLREMGPQEYRDRAAALFGKIESSLVYRGLNGFADSASSWESISAESLSEFKSTFREDAEGMRNAIAGVRALRPPAECAQTHRQLLIVVDSATSDLAAMESLVNATSPGSTYGDFSDRWSNLSESLADGWTESLGEAYTTIYEDVDIASENGTIEGD